MKTDCLNFNKIDFFVKNKFYLLLLLAITSSNLTLARQLTPEEALQKYREEKNIQTYSTRSFAEPKLIERFNATEGNNAALYIFETSEKQRLVLSASDRVPALLGYYDNNLSSNDEMPEALRWWLSEYADQISYIENNPLSITNNIEPFSNEESKAIGPLLTTQWGQGDPYNRLCPEISGSTAVTGCVATAMAQVMNYHKWPDRGVGSKSYISGGRVYSIDFSEIEFDWDNILDSYDSNSSEESINAVATLMKACGYSVNMIYSPTASGASTTDIAKTPSFFKYSNNLYFAERMNYSSQQWEELVLDQLEKGLPIIYCGRDGIWTNSVGHCFVCDGYDGNGYFHFNWGWEGFCDGYFLLTSLVPSGAGTGGSLSGYNFNQKIAVNFYPDFTEITPLDGCRGTSISVSSSNNYAYMSSVIYPENTNSTTTTKTFGLEFTPISGGDSFVYSLGEFNYSSSYYNYWLVSIGFTRKEIENIGLSEGSYQVRIMYQDNEIWKRVNYPKDTENSTLLTITEKDIDLSLIKKDAQLTITDVKFNQGSTIIKDIANTLTYVATNLTEEPIYMASMHYIQPKGNDFPLNSVYNINLNLSPGESKTITIPLAASKTSGFSNGDYYLWIRGGIDLFKMEDLYKDEERTIRITDSSESISDDLFNYFDIGEGKVLLIGLKDKSSKLRGDVVIPVKTTIQEKEYDIMGINVEFTDILDIDGLESIDIQFPITSIPTRAFYQATNLKNITLPESLTQVGSAAFWGCESLTSIKLPHGVTELPSYLFYNCKSLEKIDMPSVIKLDYNLFYNCESLKSIKLNEGITELPLGVFWGCKALEEVKIPSTISTIGSGAFYQCESLKNIVLPVGVQAIPAFCFSWCYALESIEIPNSVSQIESQAFNYCTSLRSIEIPDGITEISYNTFTRCSSLKQINIPSSVKVLGHDVFNGCSSLKSLELPEGIMELPDNAFYGCSSLEKINVPSSVKVLGQNVFNGCSSLKSLELPEGITQIPNYAFAYCSSLEKINLPETLESIEYGSFFNCGYLNYLKLPKNLKEISEMALNGIGDLTFVPHIECESLEPPLLKDNSFSYKAYNGMRIKVPEASFEKYHIADVWSNFINMGKIEEVILGDSNDNGFVTVADAVNTVNFAIGKEVDYIHFNNADVNKDGNLTLADASGTISIILDSGLASNYLYNTRSILTEKEDHIECVFDKQNSAGDRFFKINLLNENEYTAIQGDIIIPQGIEIINLSLGQEIKNTHSLITNSLGEGILRFIIYSNINNRIPKNIDSIFEMEIKTDSKVTENIEINRIIASDIMANDYFLYFVTRNDPTTAMINQYEKDNIRIEQNNNKLTIYNAQGEDITLYGISGILLTQFKATSDIEEIDIEKGIYIVAIGKFRKKLLVK